jgi:hypothetical protein
VGILWTGGEDLDFPNGAAVTIDVTSGRRRSSYSRCALTNGNSGTGASFRSLSFAGGAVTSAWLHAQVNLTLASTSYRMVGLSLNSAANGAGLYVGTDSTTSTKTALWKFDGTTWTSLATETSTSLNSTGINPIDLSIASFGASATVKVYVDGNLVITYNGSTTITGVTNLDCVSIISNSGTAYGQVSEIIVGTADTRAMSLATLAPNAAGDTNNWTNAYTNINPVTINDANVVYVNTTAQDFQANLTDLPSGSFSVQAVKIAVRAEVTAGATPTGLKLGVKSGGTVNVGSAQTGTVAFTTYESLLTQNPVTSAAWTPTDINALQLDLQSA